MFSLYRILLFTHIIEKKCHLVSVYYFHFLAVSDTSENDTKADVDETIANKSTDESEISKFQCRVCMENDKEIIFVGCGHGSCMACSNELKKCHICRKRIRKKIRLF